MGLMANIGDWTEDRLNNWMAQRFNLQGNVRSLINRAVADSAVPAGNVEWTAGSSAPVGYLLCDGASYLRADYPKLFDVIGTTYGAVDAAHFNVPDYQGRPLFMKGTHADVDALTDNDGLAAASRTPVHKHHKGTFNVGLKIDGSVAGSFDNVAAGGSYSVTDDTFYVAHVHAVPAFDTDTATAPYAVALAIIKT